MHCHALRRKLGYLLPGQYFGEYSCLLGEARTATVVATDFCELYSLSRNDLEVVVGKWPELAAEFDRLIEGFKRHRSKQPTDSQAAPEAATQVKGWWVLQGSIGCGGGHVVHVYASQTSSHVFDLIAATHTTVYTLIVSLCCLTPRILQQRVLS